MRRTPRDDRAGVSPDSASRLLRGSRFPAGASLRPRLTFSLTRACQSRPGSLRESCRQAGVYTSTPRIRRQTAICARQTVGYALIPPSASLTEPPSALYKTTLDPPTSSHVRPGGEARDVCEPLRGCEPGRQRARPQGTCGTDSRGWYGLVSIVEGHSELISLQARSTMSRSKSSEAIPIRCQQGTHTRRTSLRPVR